MNPLPTLLSDNWRAFQAINGQAGHHPLFDQLMIVSANDLILLLPLLLLASWVLYARWSPLLRLADPAHRPDRRLAQQMVLVGCGAIVLALAGNFTLAHLIYEPRPFVSHPAADHLLVSHPADASFPSDHMAIAVAIAATLAYYLLLVVAEWAPGKGRLPLRDLGASLRPLGLPALLAGLALLAAVIIGFARVYVGLHYPGDVIGGAACGFVAASLLTFLRLSLRPVLDPLIALAERLRLA